MNNKFLVAVLLMVSAIFGLLGYLQEEQKKYHAAMNVATEKYLAGSKITKLTIYSEEMAVATYTTADGRKCESHLVNLLSKPDLGLFGTLCKGRTL